MTTEIWYAVIAAVLTLIVTIAHSRGVQLPILSQILDMINGPAPVPPLIKPSEAIRQIVRDELANRPPRKEPARQPTVKEVAPGKIEITMPDKPLAAG